MCYRCGHVIQFIPDVTDLRDDIDFPTLLLGFRRDDEGAAITPATERPWPWDLAEWRRAESEKSVLEFPCGSFKECLSEGLKMRACPSLVWAG